MNALQALAVAAAALAISGDAWSSIVSRAEARLTSLLAHTEAAAEEFVTATADRLRENSCAEQQYSEEIAQAESLADETTVRPVTPEEQAAFRKQVFKGGQK